MTITQHRQQYPCGIEAVSNGPDPLPTTCPNHGESCPEMSEAEREELLAGATDTYTEAVEALEAADLAAANHVKALDALAALERGHTAAKLNAIHRLEESQGWSFSKADQMARIDQEFLTYVQAEDDMRVKVAEYDSQKRHELERAKLLRTKIAAQAGITA